MVTPLEEKQIRDLLTTGAIFEKSARNGKKKSRFLRCSKDLDTLYLSESKKAWMKTEVKMSSVTDVLENTDDACSFIILTSKKRFELQVCIGTSIHSYFIV